MKKKTLSEIIAMSDDELLDYYKSIEMLCEDNEATEEEFLGYMSEEELCEKYHLIPQRIADEIIESKYHINDYLNEARHGNDKKAQRFSEDPRVMTSEELMQIPSDEMVKLIQSQDDSVISGNFDNYSNEQDTIDISGLSKAEVIEKM